MKALGVLLVAGLALWAFPNGDDGPARASDPLNNTPGVLNLLWRDLETGGDGQINYWTCESPVPSQWVVGIEDEWDAELAAFEFDAVPDCAAQTVLRFEDATHSCAPNQIGCFKFTLATTHETHFDLDQVDIIFDREKFNALSSGAKVEASAHEWGHNMSLDDHSMNTCDAETIMGTLSDPPCDQGPTPSDLLSVQCNVYSVTSGLCLPDPLDVPAEDVVSASIGTSDPLGTKIAETPLSFFPRAGITFLILSSGQASSAYAPNLEGNLSYKLGGLNNSQGEDLVQLTLQLQVPDPFICFAFDFAFYSEEFPEFVGTQFNDTFIAELGPPGAASTFVIVGSEVVAPNNIAFDSIGNAIDVNSVFGFSADTGTTYDGAVGPLDARSEVVPGTQIELVFSIMDLADSVYDSAVFLDNFRWTMDPSESCQSGAVGIDEDNDGWSTIAEVIIGTDPFDDCADNPTDDAWPADINNDTFSDIGDIIAVAGFFGQAVPPAPARLNVAPDPPDGFVDIGDIIRLAGLFGQSCV